MRRHGACHDASGLGTQDHGCLVYADDDTFTREGVGYLREGLALGQRAMYVSSVPEATMRDHLAGLGDVDELLRAGALELVALRDAYTAATFDAAHAERTYEAAIDRALADGFAGLRTLAEMSPLMAAGRDAAEAVRWEACADRMMAERPWSALCCYDGRQVPADAAADVAAVHPLDLGARSPASFHLFSASPDRLALTGSLCTFTSASFERVLDLAAPGHDFVLDLSGLDFADHNGVLAIAQRVRGTARPRMSVSRAPYMVTRVAELMGVAL